MAEKTILISSAATNLILNYRKNKTFFVCEDTSFNKYLYYLVKSAFDMELSCLIQSWKLFHRSFKY